MAPAGTQQGRRAGATAAAVSGDRIGTTGLPWWSRHWLLVVAGIALVVRCAYALHRRGMKLGGDPYYYHSVANLVADGKGFVNPIAFALEGRSLPSADHPPLFTLYLAAWSRAGATSVGWHLFASALLGTASVVLLALAGRRLGGPRVGWLAGTIAALAPTLWMWDGLLASESMAIFTVSLYLLAVLRYLDRPSLPAIVAVAAAGALSGLARAEFVLLVAAVVPLALRTEPLERSTRVRWVAAAGAVALLVLAPWTAYNAGRFDKPVALSTGLGLVLASSSCNAAWYGDNIGYWDFGCSTSASNAVRTDEEVDTSVNDARLRKVALEYQRDHAERAPAVVAARLGRVSGLFRPVAQARLLDTLEGSEEWLAGIVMSTWYLLAGFGVIGALTLRRAGVPLVALAAPLFTVLLITVITYGIVRFRAPADTVVVLLAAVGLDQFVRHRVERSSAESTSGLLSRYRRSRPPSPPRPAPSTPIRRA